MNINMKESRDRMERAWSKYAQDATGDSEMTTSANTDLETPSETKLPGWSFWNRPPKKPPQVTYLYDPDRNIYLQHVFYPDEGTSVLKVPGYRDISTDMSSGQAEKMYQVMGPKEWSTQANSQYQQRKQEHEEAVAEHRARQNPESYLSDQGAVMHRDSHGGYMERDSEGNLTGKIVGGDLARRRRYGMAQVNLNQARPIPYADNYKQLNDQQGPIEQDLMKRRDESNRSVNAEAKKKTRARQEIWDREEKAWNDYVASRYIPNRGQRPELTVFNPHMESGLQLNPVKKNISGTT